MPASLRADPIAALAEDSATPTAGMTSSERCRHSFHHSGNAFGPRALPRTQRVYRRARMGRALRRIRLSARCLNGQIGLYAVNSNSLKNHAYGHYAASVDITGG
jgi:hypothetical protein